MGDIAFIFDQTKRFSDIQIVGGDFLLCDIESKQIADSESDGIALEINIESTNPDISVIPPRQKNGIAGGKTLWGDGDSISQSIYWDSFNLYWVVDLIWGTFPSPSVNEKWTNPSSDSYGNPLKTGWSVGDQGSLAVTLSYKTPDLIKTNSITVSSLQVSVELSIFTDRRATTAEIQQFQRGLQERQTRRGFWGNSLKEYTQGSGLWLLHREKKTEETLARAKTYCEDSLQWLVDTGVVSSVLAQTSYDGDALIIAVDIVKPDGQTADFKYGFTWDSLEVIA